MDVFCTGDTAIVLRMVRISTRVDGTHNLIFTTPSMPKPVSTHPIQQDPEGLLRLVNLDLSLSLGIGCARSKFCSLFGHDILNSWVLH